MTIPTDNELAKRIGDDLVVFADSWKMTTSEYSKDAVAAFCDILLRGGKRFRGILAYRSYYYSGGSDDTVAIAAARIFEILQASLLIVDDIADRSELRRGGPSAHILLKTASKQQKLKGDATHYGNVQAMNVAYAGPPKAVNELLTLPVSDVIKARTIRQFNDNILTTISGQIDDVFNEVTPEHVSEAMIESVLRRKTALYTFLSPLELGAQLAGREVLPEALRNYSLAAGCAFQIADDIISTFGSSKTTGKGSNDDIREGKVTLLARYALDTAPSGDKKTLQAILGNTNATEEECGSVRHIFETTGAVSYAHERFAFYAAKARAALSEANESTEFTAYLSQLIDQLARSI